MRTKKIGVQHGTTGDLYVTQNIKQPERYSHGPLAVAALLAGKIDAVVVDSEPAEVYVSQRQNLKILKEPLTGEEYAFAISKENSELLEKFNFELKKMRDSGELAEIIAGLDEKECFNLAGETGIHELIHVLKHASGCLANDSGVMHLAAAVGTPGVAPFGPTDPVATSPLSKRWRIVFEKRACSPCFKRVCPYGTKVCFDPVTPELVSGALSEVMNQK